MPKLQASTCEHIENEKTRKNINFFFHFCREFSPPQAHSMAPSVVIFKEVNVSKPIWKSELKISDTTQTCRQRGKDTDAEPH
jgi:hypothetical protein